MGFILRRLIRGEQYRLPDVMLTHPAELAMSPVRISPARAGPSLRAFSF
jgi:hypothetical protein